MPSGPVSEALFEKLCAGRGVACRSIPRGPQRTPDYEIWLGGTRVICEIKQIQPNAADLEDLRDVDVAVGRFVPNRFRSKLKDSAQLKAAADSGVPTLLVVYDNTPFKMYSANFEVLQALFGVESVVVRVPKQSGDEMLVSPSFFAGNRGLTPDQNTSVSAVAILEEDGPESDLRLRVYHNPYASVVLAPHLLRILPVAERVMPGDKTVSL